ncbi:MAG: DUF1343 domain-containing protein [Bacteroidales bacterium]|nr:DUF1343 domain-containing protein [Bacteroidales bacterium]
MKRYILTLVAAAVAVLATAQVKPGVEVLRDGGFKQLQGKRVGLVTNPSGVDRDLKSTVDILNEAEGVKLVALFGPEHGVRGNVHAGDAVADAVDEKTGVKTYSLYGKTKRPSAEMLKDIDVLVYDIQDIGCRSYTFYATMGECMVSCALTGTEFMVLDRPNPVGGNKVEGNLVEDGFFSFVSRYEIPYLYGLTPGELAAYLNEEGIIAKECKKADPKCKAGLKAKLNVVPMEGWKRAMKYSETGMPWVAPSPQIPTPEHSYFYAMSGVIGELYAFNTGIGYTLPFQCFATPYLNADKLADAMTALNLPGFRFRPINFKPFFKVGPETADAMKEMHGVQVYITDIEKANLTLCQFYFLQVLRELHPDAKIFDANAKRGFGMFDKVMGTDQIRKLFSKRYKVADIEAYFNKDAAAFKAKSSKYYLYQ